MATIAAANFYNGKTKKEYRSFTKKLCKIAKQADRFEQRPFSCKHKTSAFAPSNVWNCFFKQSQAFENAERCKASVSGNVHIFAKELSANGNRQYIVTTYNEFWNRYSKVEGKDKHFYELIPAKVPCRLYCDLEFSKEMNPDVDGIEVLEIFIHLVCYVIKKLFAIECSREEIVDLDSSTKVKFSRHLIFHLPGAIFADNKICGNLMKYIYEMARRKCNINNSPEVRKLKTFDVEDERHIPIPDDINVKKLFIKNKDGEKTFFCDLGVYTVNRNFRIFGSTKIKKNSPLVRSEQNCFTHKKREDKFKICECDDEEYNFFLDTLVCFDHDAAFKGFRILGFDDIRMIHPRHFHHSILDHQMIREEGHQSSPLPCLDEFIIKQVCKGGVQGTIRRWIHFPRTQTMVYDIDRNHWCDNIGRAHSSNHIYIVVDLKSAVFFQKCHDPDCQLMDYKSEEKPLPQNIKTNLNAKYLDDSDFLIESFDESSRDLIEAVEEAEFEKCIKNEEQMHDVNADGRRKCTVTDLEITAFDRESWPRDLPLVPSDDFESDENFFHNIDVETCFLSQGESKSNSKILIEKADYERKSPVNRDKNELFNDIKVSTVDRQNYEYINKQASFINSNESNYSPCIEMNNQGPSICLDFVPMSESKISNNNEKSSSCPKGTDFKNNSTNYDIPGLKSNEDGQEENLSHSNFSTDLAMKVKLDNERNKEKDNRSSKSNLVNHDCFDSRILCDYWDSNIDFPDELVLSENDMEQLHQIELGQQPNKILPINAIASTPCTGISSIFIKSINGMNPRSDGIIDAFEDGSPLLPEQTNELKCDDILRRKTMNKNATHTIQEEELNFSDVRNDLSFMFLDDSVSDVDLL